MHGENVADNADNNNDDDDDDNNDDDDDDSDDDSDSNDDDSDNNDDSDDDVGLMGWEQVRKSDVMTIGQIAALSRINLR